MGLRTSARPVCLQCPSRADVLIWGKFAPKDALGPRCMRHGEEHLGNDLARRTTQYAVVDLRVDPPASVWCRQCRDELPYGTANLPTAVVVIWSPAMEQEALGPKCGAHAAAHLGPGALSGPLPAGVYDLRTAAQRNADRGTMAGFAQLRGELERLVVDHAEWSHPLDHGDLTRARGTVPVTELYELLRAHGSDARSGR